MYLWGKLNAGMLIDILCTGYFINLCTYKDTCDCIRILLLCFADFCFCNVLAAINN